MKNNRFSFLWLWLGISLFFSCTEDTLDNCVKDLGNVLSENRTVSDFQRISFDGVGNIFITQGSPQSLRIEANERVLDILKTNVSNGTLDIRLERCVQGDNYELDMFITMEDIESISLNGVGNVTAVNDWNVNELTVNLNGVGDITLAGIADQLDVNSNGVGHVRAFGLVSRECRVVVTGTGSVEVSVTDELDVTINGAADVRYIGSPDITVSINGTGSLIDAG